MIFLLYVQFVKCMVMLFVHNTLLVQRHREQLEGRQPKVGAVQGGASCLLEFSRVHAGKEGLTHKDMLMVCQCLISQPNKVKLSNNDLVLSVGWLLIHLLHVLA